MRPGESIDHERSAARVASAPVAGASAPTQGQRHRRHCYLGHEHQANLVFAPDLANSDYGLAPATPFAQRCPGYSDMGHYHLANVVLAGS